MDAEWFQGRTGEFDSFSVDVYTRHEQANGHEVVVPQNGVHDCHVEYWRRSGDDHATSNLLWPVVEIVEMSLPEVLDDEWPDPDDRDGVGRVDG